MKKHLIVLAAICCMSASVSSFAGMCDVSFDKYERSLPKLRNGVYLVDGDQPVEDIHELRHYFKSLCSTESGSRVSKPEPDSRSAVRLVNGVRSIWSDEERHDLTYCIRTQGTFGWSNPQQFQAVRLAMQFASQNWEQYADVDYIYKGECQNSGEVVFSVSRSFGVGQGGQFAAAAFFPDFHPFNRDIKIAADAWDGLGTISLTGLLRHELGHTLGLVHEHGRVQACAEGQEGIDWEALTSYDLYSVMHYRNTCGAGNGDYYLSARDRDGIAILYPEEVVQPPTNIKPIARLTASPNPAYYDEIVAFDASQSYDPDGTIVTYRWFFDDGNVEITSTPYIEHVYPLAQRNFYSPTVTVYDDDGSATSDAVNLPMMAPPQLPPTAAFSVTGNGYTGSSQTFDASASQDADGEIVSYGWDFGDGNQLVTQSSTVTHTYTRVGDFVTALSVVDDDGIEDTVESATTISLSPAVIVTIANTVLL